MICYHGTPLSGTDFDAARALSGRDAMVSFAHPGQLEIAAEVCRSVVLDNGAFSAWKSGRPVADWSDYYAWVREWMRHPSVEWAVIPDDIEGDERANDSLLLEWPFAGFGVPVWHLHESLDRLRRLMCKYHRIALGSSGQYAVVGTPDWWGRIGEAMRVLTDKEGRPARKLHGLRMLDPTVLAHLPLSSADSTNAARNIAYDGRWGGPYAPKSKAVRAQIIMDRIESHAKAARWCATSASQRSFELLDYGEPA